MCDDADDPPGDDQSRPVGAGPGGRLPTRSANPEIQRLIERLGLAPMPLEGGMFRRLWAGPTGPDGRPTGTSIIVLVSAADGMFSAMHRLPIDEVWHFYLGDPLEMLLLQPDGSWTVELLGPKILDGQRVQYTVPAGTWMGARARGADGWSLFGCTMAPGFLSADYEGADVADLSVRYPDATEHIRALGRPGLPMRHPDE